MTALPTSPEELLDRLFAIFPRFQANYDGPIFDQPLSYDSVLTAFTSDFGLEFPNSSDDQLRDFAALLNAAVAHGGELERAFSQCFLDHALQIHIDHVLLRYLSSAARERIKP
jgi:hypothetical protein